VTTTDRSIVLVAPPEQLALLTERAQTSGAEVLAFSESDALLAVEAIASRRPNAVLIDGRFASTARGAALIHRVHNDPSLAECEVRIVSSESDAPRVAARTADRSASPALDRIGTRRSPRFKMGGSVSATVDGNSATLVDLSATGAQVVSRVVLKPNQRVRMTITDEHRSVRFNATIAWASFEIPAKSGPHYRAGVEFVDADKDAIAAFCGKHQKPDE
jgi:archaeosine-15-forming tRNA-guanine transglycosylase